MKIFKAFKYFRNHGPIAFAKRVRAEFNSHSNSNSKSIDVNFTLADHYLGKIFEVRKNSVEEMAESKLTVFLMVKNEIELLNSCILNNLKLFDRVIVIDHMSDDGTFEMLKNLETKYKHLEVYRFVNRGYYQSVLMTWAYDYLINKNEKGWVFFLDADEFLNFKSKEKLKAELMNHKDSDCLLLPWVNVIPSEFTGESLDIDYHVPSLTSIYNKIALQPRRLKGKRFKIAQGNHSLECDFSTAQSITIKSAFPVMHFPIRSQIQLEKKIAQGIKAYEAMKNKGRKDGFHWYQINELLSEGSSELDGVFRGMVFHYAEPNDEIKKYDLIDLKSLGCDLMKFEFFQNIEHQVESRDSRRYVNGDPKDLMYVHQVVMQNDEIHYD
jgi:glycosyltransferase involved in cell wall biosynthesis